MRRRRRKTTVLWMRQKWRWWDILKMAIVTSVRRNKWQQSLLTCRGVWSYLQTPREKMGTGHQAHQRNPLRSFSSVQFISVAQLCPTLCDPMDCSTPGFPIHHQLLEVTQTHVHLVGDAIQPSHPLLSPSPPTFNLFQHQGLFQWVSSSYQVAKVLEFQLQHQSFQWIFRTYFL